MATFCLEKEEMYEELEKKVERLCQELGVAFPTMTEGELYQCDEKSFWTKGFWPGILWNLYQREKNPRYAEIARAIETKLDDVLNGFYEIHHDAGFVWSLTAVADYKLTGNPESRRRALTAASHLAGRFNLKGRFIRAWNERQGANNAGWAIIDCCLNLPLLYWASEETGDPRFRHIAMAHADTVLREFVRVDGSTYHIVCFDPETGVCLDKKAGQGAGKESAWARGQAWLLYGMALGYRYTKESRYLRASTAAADFFIKNLPVDNIPYWDFRVEGGEEVPRDTSAAACAACGLLELGKHPEIPNAELYHVWGEYLVKSLYAEYWNGKKSQGLLSGGTFNFPAGKGINVSLIYGDYFYAEALTRMVTDAVIFW